MGYTGLPYAFHMPPHVPPRRRRVDIRRHTVCHTVDLISHRIKLLTRPRLPPKIPRPPRCLELLLPSAWISLRVSSGQVSLSRLSSFVHHKPHGHASNGHEGVGAEERYGSHFRISSTMPAITDSRVQILYVCPAFTSGYL